MGKGIFELWGESKFDWKERLKMKKIDLFLKNQFLYLDILQIYEIICDIPLITNKRSQIVR